MVRENVSCVFNLCKFIMMKQRRGLMAVFDPKVDKIKLD